MSAPILAALGVDQAARSGFGMSVNRQVVETGVATTKDERIAVVKRAIELAGGNPRQLLVMFENHGGMPITRLTNHDRNTPRSGRQGAPQRSTAGLIGMGVPRGWWEERLRDAGSPEALWDDVEPRTWRAKLGIRQLDDEAFGRWCAQHGVKPSSTTPWKAAACLWLSAHLGRDVTDPDEGDGGCIAAFAGIDGLMRREARLAEARSKARVKRTKAKQLDIGDVLGGKAVGG